MVSPQFQINQIIHCHKLCTIPFRIVRIVHAQFQFLPSLTTYNACFEAIWDLIVHLKVKYAHNAKNKISLYAFYFKNIKKNFSWINLYLLILPWVSTSILFLVTIYAFLYITMSYWTIQDVFMSYLYQKDFYLKLVWIRHFY